MKKRAVGALGATAIVLALFGGTSGASAIQPQCFSVALPVSAAACVFSNQGNAEAIAAVFAPSTGAKSIVFAGRSVDGALVASQLGEFGGVVHCYKHSWYLFTFVGHQGHDKNLNVHCNG
jgi:hypothetical protein